MLRKKAAHANGNKDHSISKKGKRTSVPTGAGIKAKVSKSRAL